MVRQLRSLVLVGQFGSLVLVGQFGSLVLVGQLRSLVLIGHLGYPDGLQFVSLSRFVGLLCISVSRVLC